jgi:hypothetical protein
MSWLKRILIGLGIVLALLIAIVVVVGYWGAPSGPVTQTMSMTVGSRTVTVGGHYKNMTQESLAEGVKVTVDGHEIEVSADQLEVDGKTQVLEPGQDVEVWVNEKGAVDVKVVHADAGSPGKATE